MFVAKPATTTSELAKFSPFFGLNTLISGPIIRLRAWKRPYPSISREMTTAIEILTANFLEGFMGRLQTCRCFIGFVGNDVTWT